MPRENPGVDPRIDIKSDLPPTIEHDPYEFSNKGNGIWWFWVFALPALWGAVVFTREIDAVSVALGIGTAAIITAWAFDITGGKVPASWRRQPPRR